MGQADLVGDHVLGALEHRPGPLGRAIQDLDQRHPAMVLRAYPALDGSHIH